MSLEIVWDNEQEEYEIKDDLISLLESILQKAGEMEGIEQGERSEERRVGKECPV